MGNEWKQMTSQEVMVAGLTVETEVSTSTGYFKARKKTFTETEEKPGILIYFSHIINYSKCFFPSFKLSPNYIFSLIF